MGHLLMKNRNGLIVDGCVTEASGWAERIEMAFAFSAAACNLVRLPKLLSEPVMA